MLREFTEKHTHHDHHGQHTGTSTPTKSQEPPRVPEPVPKTDAKPSEATFPKSTHDPNERALTGDDEIYHVKSHRRALPHELDLNRADEEAFSPEKLRTTLEWFYMSVVIGLLNIRIEIARIRSWRERQRTALFCATYFIAWICNLLIFTSTSTILLLILSPSFQSWLFPPDPGFDDDGNGHPKYVRVNSLTGVPEAHKGETAEQEATDLVRDIAEVTLETAVSEYDDQSDGAEEFEESAGLRNMPPAGDEGTSKQMMQRVSMAMVDVIRITGDITEIYERFCNLVSPTPPFDLVWPRLRLVAILGVIALSGVILSSHTIVKGITFIIGIGFFGMPLFDRLYKFLNRRFPHWQEELDIRETILKDVPTNAQITLTLLRMGEMTSTPLSPPPSTIAQSPTKIARREKPTAIPPAEALALEASGLPFAGLIKLIRASIGVGISLRMIMDRAISVVGMSHPPHLIGLLRKRGWVSAPVGPLKFKAQYERRRGTVVIDSTCEPPVLYFTTHGAGMLGDSKLKSQHKASVLFSIPVPEIVELKKTEKLGWKQKLVLELTGGVKYSLDGLVIRGKRLDQMYHLTAVKERDQLFNRLVAMGAQFWESW